MATVVNRGGYAGGGRSSAPDMSSIQQSLQARNQRLDLAQAERLNQSGVPGLAYLASQGDTNAERFLRRYYGGDNWQQYVPQLVQEPVTRADGTPVLDPETGEQMMGPALVPPEGVPWDWSKREAFSRNVFGAMQMPGQVQAQQEEATGEAAPMSPTRDRPAPLEPKSKDQPTPEQGTAAVAPPPSTPPASTSAATDTTTTEPTPSQDGGAAELVAGDAGLTAVEVGAPADEVQPNREQQALVESALGAYEIWRSTQDPRQKQAAQLQLDRLLPRIKYRDETGALRSLSDISQLEPFYMQALQERAAQSYQQTPRRLPPYARTPGRYDMQQDMRPQPATGGIDGSLQEGPSNLGIPYNPAEVEPGTPRPIQPESVPGVGPQSRAPQISGPIGGRYAMPAGDMPLPGAERGEQRQQPQQVTRSAQQQMRGAQAQTIGEGKPPVAAKLERGADRTTGALVERLILGNESIPVRSRKEHVVAQHAVKYLTEPDSPRGRAGRAAMQQVIQQNSSQLRERVRQTGTMVPAGEFARRVHDFVQNDPERASMIFTELTNNLLSARTQTAAAEYNQALGAQARATAEAAQAENQVFQENPQLREKLLRAKISQAEAQAQILEATAGVSTRRAEAEIDQILEGVVRSETERKLLAKELSLERARLDLQERIADTRGSGDPSAGLDLLLELFETDAVAANKEVQLGILNMFLAPFGAEVTDTGFNIRRDLLGAQWGLPDRLQLGPAGGGQEPSEGTSPLIDDTSLD